MNDSDHEDDRRLERSLRQADRVQRAVERASRGKDNVLACRLDNETLDAVDTLVEAGVRSTRADAAAWLIGVGLEANKALLDELSQTVAEIRRLRKEATDKAQRLTRPDTEPAAPTDGD